ncbi:MAG: type II toxin-antitoxin system VapC family toxin [Thermoproteota archaeon]
MKRRHTIDKICLDTSIFINAKNESERGSRMSKRLLKSIAAGRIQGIFATITLAELLNGAYRVGREEAEKVKASFEAFESKGSIMVSFDKSIADKIGELCAKHNIRIKPDVIIVASALKAEARAIVTRNVRDFKIFEEDVAIIRPEDLR